MYIPLLSGGGSSRMAGLAGGRSAPGCSLVVEPQGMEVFDQCVQSLLLLVDDVQVVGQGREQSLPFWDNHVSGRDRSHRGNWLERKHLTYNE